MSITLVTALVLVACVIVGVALYVLDAPGRRTRPGNARMARRLAEERTFERAEEKFQAKQAEKNVPPTHEQP